MPKETPTQRQRAEMLENYRLQVVEEELLARMNKASYEKMYFYIEGIKIIPEYSTLVDAAEKRRDELQSKARTAGEEILGTISTEEESLPPTAGLIIGPTE